MCPYYLAATVLSVLIIVLLCQTAAYSKSGKSAVALSSATTLRQIGQFLPGFSGASKTAETAFSVLAELAEDIDIEDAEFQEAPQEPANNEVKWKTVRMRVTGYCPCEKCCGRHSDGKTANMHHIKWGDRFVAAPKGYKFGTEMIVPGYNGACPVKVYDRGRAIYGNRLDVFFNTHYSAKKWGVRYLDVKVRVN